MIGAESEGSGERVLAESSSLEVEAQGPSRAGPAAFGRLIIALTCLIALQFDPPTHSIAPAAVVPLLLGYVLFAFVVLVGEPHGEKWASARDWADLAWGLVLTTVTGGTASVLFFVLLLPIISRSFREGFRAGWILTCVATLGFLLMGLPSSPGGVMFEFNRAVTRPLILLILGYVIAREGGEQKRSQRHLALLADFNTVANPRMGTERTLLNAAEQLRKSYAVRECLILVAWENDERCLLVQAREDASESQVLPVEAVGAFLALPEDRAQRYVPSSLFRRFSMPVELRETCEAVADLLDAEAFLSIPMNASGQARARIFVVDRDLSRFDEAEVAFLSEAGRHLFLIVEKIDLLDRLASFAAERERRRLASDLHDMAIQPYLGLQLGLTALLRRPECSADIAEELEALLRLSQQGATELRRILAGQRAATGGEDVVVESIARLVEHYRDQLGVDVRFESAPGLQISDRLATDLLGMVYEGLSNIRRHTTSTWARILLRMVDGELELLIANERGQANGGNFIPRSLSERAAALGGTVDVDTARRGETLLRIRIPL